MSIIALNTKSIYAKNFQNPENTQTTSKNFYEILPSKSDIKIIKKIINEYQDKNEFKDLKKLYDLIYGAFEEFSHNYYFAVILILFC